MVSTSSLQVPHDTDHLWYTEKKNKYYQSRRLLPQNKILYIFHCFHPQSPEEMDEPFAEGSRANETWLSGSGCHRQLLSIKNALPPFARHSKARRAVKSIPAEHNYHHYLQGDTEEGESCFGFFEAYLFQWKCYQKGQIFKPARVAPSLHLHPPHTELFSGP